MPKFTLHLLMPGLLDRARNWAQDYSPFPRFAAIEAIMAKSRRESLHAHGADATLCAMFGLTAQPERDLPLGAVRRHGYGGDRDAGFWLCADPVHLSAGIAQVFLRGGETLDITRFEANQLASQFTAHFAGQDWALEVASPRHWHLCLPVAPMIRTAPERQVMGRPIEMHLPVGADAVFWRAVLNEIQMLFHGATVNRDRAQKGEMAINGLWVSGAGILPPAGALHTGITAVWADDPLAIGLSRLASIATRPTPQSLNTILQSGARGSHLVFLDSLLAPASYDDLSAWSEALRGLQTAWFRPINAALKTARLARCHLYDCAGQRFSLSRARRWLLWRRRKPLHIYDRMRVDESLRSQTT